MKKMAFEDRISEHYQLDLIYASERKESFMRKKAFLEELISIIGSDYLNDKGVEFNFFCCNTTKVPTFIEDARLYFNGKDKYIHIEESVRDIENLAQEANDRCGFYRHQALTDFLNHINTPEEKRPQQFNKPQGLRNRMKVESDFSPLLSRRDTSYNSTT